jgi:RNA polymerase sigma factor (sigma-70 family)
VTRTGRVDETSLVVAAQAGDPRALDELVTAYLPLVYTIARRALGGLADVDDVVQETMLRVLRELRALRNPESFRPWLMAITTRQVGTHLRRRKAVAERTTTLDELTDAPAPDAESLALLRLELSSQRRQAARASRWLDPDDEVLLSLWWLETAGLLTRTELAATLGMSVAHAGVRVQRMRNQLELSRSLVVALEAGLQCAQLSAVLEEWDGVPSPLWRKRVTRHTRGCVVCAGAAEGLVPLERLIVGLALVPVRLVLSPPCPAGARRPDSSPSPSPPGPDQDEGAEPFREDAARDYLASTQITEIAATVSPSLFDPVLEMCYEPQPSKVLHPRQSRTMPDSTYASTFPS